MRGSIFVKEIDRSKTYYKSKFNHEDIEEQPFLEGKTFLLLPCYNDCQKIYWYINYGECIEIQGEMYIGTDEPIDNQIRRFKDELGDNKIQYLELKNSER